MTLRELWEKAVEEGAEDYELLFMEEAEARFISTVEYRPATKEIVIG